VNRIILALDTTNLEEAINITNRIKDKIFTIKLGLEFFNAHGKEGIRKFNEIGITNLMLDLKLKDIPQTVYKAIKALDNLKFGFLTIHGQGAGTMIEKAKKAASEIKSRPKILMVTILTALNDEDLKAMGNNTSVIEQVEKLAKVAKDMNVGVVCSGQEAKTVRKIIGPNLLIFTPGIRMHRDNKDDQQRVCTPTESIKNGSDKIIMGRSLIKGNIEDNLNRISNSLKIEIYANRIKNLRHKF
jgi:orotidine-5'-phosphate decarboxylase